MLRISNPQDIYRTLPDDVKSFIQDQWKRNPNQVVMRSEPYFSRVRLAPTTISADGSNNTTYTFTSGQTADAFLYGVNGSMNGAGYGTLAAYQSATLGDTNLQNSTGRETNDNAVVIIGGISIMLDPKSDSFMASQVLGDVFLNCGFGGLYTSQYKLGNPMFMGGSGGIMGGGPTEGVLPDLASTWFNPQAVGPMNGMPIESNFRPLPDPIIWYPKGSPQSETQFGMRFVVDRQVSYVAPGRAAAAGVAAIVPPVTVGARGTYVDLLVWLKTVQVLQRPSA